MHNTFCFTFFDKHEVTNLHFVARYIFHFKSFLTSNTIKLSNKQMVRLESCPELAEKV